MLNAHLVKSWFLHTLQAKTRHGLHSPFMYRLADEVVYDRRRYPDYALIEGLRKEWLRDRRSIEVTDLGAGSQFGNKKKRKVSSIAAHALKSPKLAQLIYRLARHFRPENILELGTCLGVTTAYLARACPGARVLSIEGCPETARLAQEGFGRLGLSGIESFTGNFDEVLPGLLLELPSLDLVFVDGNHRKSATLNYFEWCLPSLHENSVMIFDDIHWSEGMEEAWECIKAHPAVSVTADLFFIGLVFFRKGQVKEHFRLRV